MKIQKYNQFIYERLDYSIRKFWKILPTSEIYIKAVLKKLNVPTRSCEILISDLKHKNIPYDYPWYRGGTTYINNKLVDKMPKNLDKQFIENWIIPDGGIFIIHDTINGYDRWDCLTKDELGKFFNKNGVYDYEGYISLSKEELEQISIEEKTAKYNI